MIYLEKSYNDWNFKEEDVCVNPRCSRSGKTVIQGKLLGGSSSLNYIQYDQGSYNDYNGWADIVSDESWKFENIQYYLKKSENVEDSDISKSSNRMHFGKGGPITVTKEKHCEVNDYLSAFKELGYNIVSELNAANPIGFSPALYNIGNYNRQGTADTYLTKAKNWPNLSVLKNALVTKILFDKYRNAVAVNIHTEIGSIKVNARKEIVICAGVINSPKLLMTSGIGPKEHLEKLNITVIQNLPVGKNLQDHVGVLLGHDMRKLTKSPVSLNPGIYPAYMFTGQVGKNPQCPDHRTLHYVNFPVNFIPYCAFTYEYSNEICDHLFANRPENQMLFTLISKLKPKSRGEVILKTANYSDPPLIFQNYLSDEQDLKGLIDNVINYMKINGTEFFKNADAVWVDPKLETCKNLEFGSFQYWECYVRCMITGESHYCGTCAMGSVVDGRLRVRGVNRLRVADSSVIPEITTGGTFAPTVMIAEKAADMLKEDNNCFVDDERELDESHDGNEKVDLCMN